MICSKRDRHATPQPPRWEPNANDRGCSGKSLAGMSRVDDSIPRESIPRESIPRESIPRESIPRESIPRERVVPSRPEAASGSRLDGVCGPVLSTTEAH
jgi:hypothetical protein